MMKVKAGARQSPLSRLQVDEVKQELSEHGQPVLFEVSFVDTYGDKDRKTSLRALDRTDFFTREVDEMVAQGIVDVGIHSAKDLPEPLPDFLEIVAITRGVDPSDSLVLAEGVNVEDLGPQSVVATSSIRREEMVTALIGEVSFCDIRGTIQERLDVLKKNEIDGVVIAEAALIRLGLTHLNRVTLPGETVPFQGQLAILARREDQDMRELFRCIDSR